MKKLLKYTGKKKRPRRLKDHQCEGSSHHNRLVSELLTLVKGLLAWCGALHLNLFLSSHPHLEHGFRKMDKNEPWYVSYTRYEVGSSIYVYQMETIN